MGKNYYFGCQNCGWELELQEGVGMMFSHPEKVLRMALEGENQRILDLLNEDATGVEGVRYQIFFCSSCETFESRLHFQITRKDEVIYQPEHTCSQCGGELTEVEEFQLIKYCPECSSQRLMTGIGDWD